MAGLGITLLSDEHIYPDLAIALRRRGYDAISCQEAGLVSRRVSDAEQLHHATRQGRAILTYDAGDFIRLDRSWKAEGRQHAGIIVVSRSVNTLSQLLARVIVHLDTISRETQHNTLLWLA